MPFCLLVMIFLENQTLVFMRWKGRVRRGDRKSRENEYRIQATTDFKSLSALGMSRGTFVVWLDAASKG